MPVPLTEAEALSIPEEVIPAVVANKAWIETILIRAPKNGVWSAITESHPADETKAYYTDAKGNDTVLRIESRDLRADMAKDPSLFTDVNAVMSGIISVTTKIKALREAEAAAAKKAQEQAAP